MTVSTRVREESGFGLVELLIAMTVMVVGITALVAGMSSGMVAVKRAGDESTAAALADTQMEAYRALPNCAIYLDDRRLASAGSAYTATAALTARPENASGATRHCSTRRLRARWRTHRRPLTTPTSRSPAPTGAPTGSTRTSSRRPQSAGTLAKKVTLVVRDPKDTTNTTTLVRETSEFAPPTGCTTPRQPTRSTGC